MGKNNKFIIIILVLVGIIILQRACTSSPEIEQPEPIIIYDSTEVIVEVEKPVPYAVYDTTFVHDTTYLFHDVDTTAILADYFKTRIYNDTLVDDEDLFFSLYEVVWQNQIQTREFIYKNRRPVEMICPELPKIRTEFYIGGFVGGNQELFGAGVGGGVLSRKRNLYTYQYDIINNEHYLSLYWRLKFRK